MSKIITNFFPVQVALKFASTEETRYYLNGVFFDRDRIVGTNGHVLAMIKPDNFKVDVPFEPFIMPAAVLNQLIAIQRAEFFKSNPCGYNHEYDEEESYCHPAGMADRVIMIDTVANEISMLPQPWLTADLEEWESNKNFYETVTLKYKPMDGTYPDYARVIPDPTGWEELPHQPTDFNPEYVARFATFGKYCTFHMSPVNTEPSIIRAKNNEYDFEALGVIMPAKADKLPALPSWFTPPPKEEKAA